MPRPPGFRAWLRVVRCYQQGSRRLAERLAALELTPAQLDILANLFAGPEEGLTQDELVRRLLVTKGNVSVLLDRLSGRGWVRREPHPQDRRSKLVVLTADGRRLAEEAVAVQWAFVQEVMQDLDGASLDQLEAALETVEARLGTSQNR